jgi:hypothetical protein
MRSCEPRIQPWKPRPQSRNQLARPTIFLGQDNQPYEKKKNALQERKEQTHNPERDKDPPGNDYRHALETPQPGLPRCP